MSKNQNLIKVNYIDKHMHALILDRLLHTFNHICPDQEIIFICIGTDRSTGDSLGPYVGMLLSKENLPLQVYGTLQNPVHALNLESTLEQINVTHKNPFIIAIDASLGKVSSVGSIQIADGPLRPGAGVNKKLPEVGDIHLTGVVNVGGFMEYFVLQNTRLSLIVSMAEVIASSIISAYSNFSNKSTEWHQANNQHVRPSYHIQH